MTTLALSRRLLPHALTRRRPLAVPGPAREGALARALRWIEDRRRLEALDARLLRDVGLTPGDVARGLPFRLPDPGRL